VILEGYIGLFFSAFLAATILPVVSEAVIAAMAVSGEFETLWLLLVASVGNTLGSVVNWLAGRYLNGFQDRRWFPMTPRQIARASQVFNRWGLWSLLLAWTPFLGDPLTFIAGLLRVPFPIFLLLVAISKTGRYIVLLGLLDQILT
tara:strand:- start:2339 stop:2776 length:438 start_codon:yes stop_codon:yes gene_type:complete